MGPCRVPFRRRAGRHPVDPRRVSVAGPRARRAEGSNAMTIARITFMASWVLVLLFLGLPILIVALLSFSSASYLTFPPPALGLRWYQAYLGSRDWLHSTWLSLT